MGIAKRGDAKPAPTSKTFQEAKVGCLQHALGQRRILLCLFSTSLVLFEYDRAVIPCRSSTSSWPLLNATSPLCGMENKVIRCSSAQVFFTVKDSNGHCHVPEGWERCSPLPPCPLLGAPPGAPPSPHPSTVSSPRLAFHLPQAGQGRIQCGQDGVTSLLVTP